MKKIKIQYWSDFICPYCYIAEQRMKNVMKELKILDKFEFKLLSFELDPNAPKERPLKIVENLAKKYNISIEESKETVDRINKLGIGEGIDFKYETCRGGNTLNAHRLVKFAENEEKNKENLKETDTIKKSEQLIHSLYDAYFTKNLLISDEKILTKLATDLGFDKGKVEELLKNDNFKEEVREDEEKAYEKGLHGVPYFMIGNEVINGCSSKEDMKKVLMKVINENKNDTDINKNIIKEQEEHPEGVVCDEHGCYLKKKH